jgi:hypothetical protein
MVNVMDLFKWMMIIQLFYAFCITGVSYAMPDNAKSYVTGFSDVTESINLEDVSNQVQDSLERQTNIPLIEIGALVFYSGNILIDLVLNFAFAIPQMLGLIISGLVLLFNLDGQIVLFTQLFMSVTITALYLISIIQLVVGLRSGRIV